MTHWQPGSSDLPTSGVTAGTYGDSTHVAQVTVAASGLVTAASNVVISGGGGGAGGILAVVSYAPNTLTSYSVTNTAGITALDTTNLTVSFTVPASGAVVVRFSASVSAPTSGSIGWGLLNHSGGAQLGYTLSNIYGLTGNSPRCTGEWYLTGLSAGTLGIDIAAGVTTGTGTVYAQGNTGAVNAGKVGPALIVVESA